MAAPDEQQKFYNAFRQWAKDTYGSWAVFSQSAFTRNQFQTSKYYKIWAEQNYPGYTTPRTAPTPVGAPPTIPIPGGVVSAGQKAEQEAEQEQAYQMYRAAATDQKVKPLSKAEWIKADMPSTPPTGEVTETKPLTAEQATAILNQYYGGEGKGYRIFQDPLTQGWVIDKDPYYKSPRETTEEWGVDPGENWHFNPNTGEWEFLPPEGYVSEGELQRRQYEKEVFDWQKEVEQSRREEEKGRQLAQLRANPASWLEYASLAGQTPAIQPWMMPLAPQQYQGLQAGQPLPGYQAGGQTMNLPGLVTPSAQYLSRMSPSAKQQYYGYEQARTGATPEDVQWRLWSQAPPGGRYTGLRRTR